ncbi:NAD(P)-binding domain-containing protein [Candidatus Bathyarchaeota archaeon]|nr:NAD(P)-binding domain-containing protein [Candidatus Bathyarchaeota archaeon]
MVKIAILGAGVMGSALTVPLAANNHEINLWGTELDTEIIEEIRKIGLHPRLNLKIPKNVETFSVEQLDLALKDRQIIVLGISSEAVKIITKRLAPYLKKDVIIVTVAKGLEMDPTGKILTMPEVIENELPTEYRGKIPIVAIGGPSIAKEVAQEIPTAVVFASTEIKAAELCREIFSTPKYRVEVTADVKGVELCAALKNTYAIAVGICEGLRKRNNLETMNNTKALVFTYAVKEMNKIIQTLGGKTETVMGLAGIGDLDVTCKGGRNAFFGEILGSGVTATQALDEMKRRKQTVEGYPTTQKAYELGRALQREGKLNIENDLPLLKELYAVLYEDKPADKAMENFLSRVATIKGQ